MENFLLGVEFNAGSYYANFADGKAIQLDAANYADAVCEADLLDECDIEAA